MSINFDSSHKFDGIAGMKKAGNAGLFNTLSVSNEIQVCFTNSTRRFLALPASVALSATG